MKTKKEKKSENLEKLKEMKKDELISTFGGAREWRFINGEWVLVEV